MDFMEIDTVKSPETGRVPVFEEEQTVPKPPNPVKPTPRKPKIHRGRQQSPPKKPSPRKPAKPKEK